MNTADGFIYVSDEFPAWYRQAIEAIWPLYDKSTNEFVHDFARQAWDALKQDPSVNPKHRNKMMSVIAEMPQRVRASGTAAFRLTPKFNQLAVLDTYREFLREQLGLATLTIYSSSDSAAPDQANKKATAVPLKPVFTFGGEKKVSAKHRK